VWLRRALHYSHIISFIVSLSLKLYFYLWNILFTHRIPTLLVILRDKVEVSTPERTAYMQKKAHYCTLLHITLPCNQAIALIWIKHRYLRSWRSSRCRCKRCKRKKRKGERDSCVSTVIEQRGWNTLSDERTWNPGRDARRSCLSARSLSSIYSHAERYSLLGAWYRVWFVVAFIKFTEI